MDIASIEIRNIFAGGSTGFTEGLEHIKSLPCISVVQSLHGFYEIGLDGDPLSRTCEGGVFVTPTGCLQHIIHHNGPEGFMEAQWAFMNVTVNSGINLEDALTLPLLLPPEENGFIRSRIAILRTTKNLCERYAAAYSIVGRLIAHSTPRSSAADETMVRIQGYIAEHYSEPIPKEELARHAFCSVPHLYRLFRKHLGVTPANYINQVRLQNAAVLLERSGLPVAEVAQRTGFDDAAYFCRLFRRQYTVSPSEYRKQNRHQS